jgi:hypothetical protein
MKRRRLFLVMVVMALVTANIIFLYLPALYKNPTATIMFVGLDSTGAFVPTAYPFAEFRQGKWVPDPTVQAREIVEDMGGNKQSLALISLMPQPTYGHFIQSVRDLKARNICNIAIREGAEPIKSDTPLPDGSFEYFSIPALVLCGQSIGDAGFYGELPPDRNVQW